MSKFLCVKGILFFSFWQSIFISILVAAGVITKVGPYTDSEHVSLALTDALVCLEMPIFAFAHQYAFSTVDFVDPNAKYVARMRMVYAFRDAFGLKDVVEDSKATLRGEGMDYREFEPSEGFMHQGIGRERRIRAGLRYSQGGKRKYWLPQPAVAQPPGNMERRVNRVIERVTGRDDQGEEVYAPLLPHQAEQVVHLAPDMRSPEELDDPILFGIRNPADEGYDLPFGDPDPADDELYEQSKKYLFGDYNYPVVDASSEFARKMVWEEEERILRDERGAYFSPTHNPTRVLEQAQAKLKGGYGATGYTPASRSRVNSNLSDGGRPSAGGLSPVVREAVVDKEEGPSPEGADGVRLRWTKLGPQSPTVFGRVRTLSNQGKAGPSSAGSSSSSSPNSAHRKPPPSPRKENERAVLPPDAVDLVVEDPHAAQVESTHDWRKGEPTALHKVYRRGYVADEDGQHEEGEVEVRDGQADAFGVGEDVDTIMRTEEEVAEDMAVTKATTPPVHARIVVDHYQVPSEDNPWAS